ncbi:hypothetical protein [Hymenobacter sp. B81]|uniref:hypothetical protein n=1 Tax=Hymenobacter sp. B81 TaxID=3344878 RepID=UPI0037DCA3F0
MTRQETLPYLKLVLSRDLNDNLTAMGLRTVLSVVIKDINNIDIQPNEEAFLLKRRLAVTTLQGILSREASNAVHSERASKSKKDQTKIYTARSDYQKAVAAIEEAIRDFVQAMEQAEGAEK